MSNPRDVPQPQEQGSGQPDSEPPSGDPLPPTGPEARSSQAPGKEAPANAAPANDARSSQAATNEASSSQAPANAVPVNDAQSNEAPSNAAPGNAAPSNEAPASQAPANAARSSEAPSSQAPGNSAGSNEAPANEKQAPPLGYRPPGGFPVPGQQQGAPHDDAPHTEAAREPHEEPRRDDTQSSGQYWQPNQPGRAGRFPFEIPADRPRNFNDVMPLGGFGGIFNVTGLPTELKVSYWIWVIGGLLGLLGGVIGLFGALVLIAIVPAVALLVFVLVIVALVLSGAQIVLAMKMKEGREWARLALTIIAGVSLLQSIISSSIVGGQGANWFGFLTSLVATILMWVPTSQSWFAAVRGRY